MQSLLWPRAALLHWTCSLMKRLASSSMLTWALGAPLPEVVARLGSARFVI